MYFIFFSDAGPTKRCRAWGSLPLLYPTLSMGLIKMHSTHSWIKCVLRSSISYHVVCYFQRKIFNTTKLLHHTALSVKLIIKRVSNLMLIIAM